MTTKIKNGNGHCEHIITRSDGKLLTVWFIGRCWVYIIGNNSQEIAGREIDENRIIHSIRRQFALNEIGF